MHGARANSLQSSSDSSSSASSSAGSGGSSHASPATTRTVCSDTCTGFTSNGVCDEGRPTANAPPDAQPDTLTIFTVQCDLGTDCADCGPWVHNNTKESDSWRPIAEIKDKKFAVFTRQVMHPSRYFVAFTDPEKDVDVSLNLMIHALFEPGYSWVWHNILSGLKGCRGPAGEQRLVVDVGANFGYYTLLAAAMGCRVVAWEPVPYFAAFLRYGLLRNNLTHAVQLREAIVSNSSGAELTIVVPNRGIWGTAGIGGANLDRGIQSDYDNVNRTTERLDEVVQEDVLLLKVDVEGFEPQVLRGAKSLLLQYSVSNLIFEYSPGVAEKARDWSWFEDHPTLLMGLLQGGYTILHLDVVHDAKPDWTGERAMPSMPQVTEAVLQHDIEDAWRLQEGSLGCLDAKLLEGLPATGARVFDCGWLPEALDPHSLRSTFGFNTNLWAFKGDKSQWASIGGPASLAPLDFDIRGRFFTPGGVLGLAHRLCHDIDPKAQVAHRCPCSDKAVCGALEERVTQLAKDGKLPPFRVQGRQVAPAKMGLETW